tara:strand:- start:2618 stop:4213 length:1596 start_codon:yes stop_codon:yes gene_type:complete
MLENILYIFLIYNINLLIDYHTKYYQLEFLESFNDNININFFLWFALFSIINNLSYTYLSYIKKTKLEYPQVTYTTVDFLNKTNNLPPIYIEHKINNEIRELLLKTPSIIFNKNTVLFEGYSSMIRLFINTYFLFKIKASFALFICCSFILYLYFYKNIINNNFKLNSTDNKKLFKLNTNYNELLRTYFNSIIGNYTHHYNKTLLNNVNDKNNLNITKHWRDIIYNSSLELYHKIILFTMLYSYLHSSCKNQCGIYFLPLYQLTTTLVYQFEYLLHNYYNYYKMDSELTNYYEFNKSYNNLRITNKTHILLDNNFEYEFNLNNINIDNFTLYMSETILLKQNKHILISGETGSGKTTICKYLSGYIDTHEISNYVLYISQYNLISYNNRTIHNIITNNDYYSNKGDNILCKYIIQSIVPLNDLLFNVNYSFNEVVTNLSGGQEKRLYIAFWLYYLIKNIYKYRVLIIDEPDKGLDTETFITLIGNILNNELLKNLCIIVVTHNYNYILELFDEHLHIYNNENKLYIKEKFI